MTAAVRFHSQMEVPKGHRKVDGVQLSLDQMTWIFEEAQRRSGGDVNRFSQCLVDARNAFREGHVINREMNRWEAK